MRSVLSYSLSLLVIAGIFHVEHACAWEHKAWEPWQQESLEQQARERATEREQHTRERLQQQENQAEIDRLIDRAEREEREGQRRRLRDE